MSNSLSLIYYRVYHDGCLLKNAEFYKAGNVWYVTADKELAGVDIAIVDKANRCVYYYVDPISNTHYLQRWTFVRGILFSKRRIQIHETQTKEERSQDWTQEN